MSTIATKAAYESAMKLRFDGRTVMSSAMSSGIARAFIISAHARVANARPMGLDLPVMFAHPSDSYAIAAKSLPKVVAVCTKPGGECVLAFYPVPAGHYECIVTSAVGLRELISMHLGINYSRYAETDSGYSAEFAVPGLETLISDDDGEFAGGLIDGSTFDIDGTIVDTTAIARIGYSPMYAEEIPLPDVSYTESDQDVAEFARAFMLDLARSIESTVAA